MIYKRNKLTPNWNFVTIGISSHSCGDVNIFIWFFEITCILTTLYAKNRSLLN